MSHVRSDSNDVDILTKLEVIKGQHPFLKAQAARKDEILGT